MTERRSLTRRRFLKGAATTAGAALALPTIVPSHVLGADAPSMGAAIASKARIPMSSLLI